MQAVEGASSTWRTYPARIKVEWISSTPTQLSGIDDRYALDMVYVGKYPGDLRSRQFRQLGQRSLKVGSYGQPWAEVRAAALPTCRHGGFVAYSHNLPEHWDSGESAPEAWLANAQRIFLGQSWGHRFLR